MQTEQDIREELSQFPEIIAEYDRLQPEVETEQEVLRELLTQRELFKRRTCERWIQLADYYQSSNGK